MPAGSGGLLRGSEVGWEVGVGGARTAALTTGCTLDMAGMGERKQLKAESFPRGSLK